MPLLQVTEISQRVTEISQQYYGDHALDAISGAGQIKQHKLVIIFINPTHRNISTSPAWDGLKLRGLAAPIFGSYLQMQA